MEKLYYENPYKKEFTAEIINVMEKDNKYHVELDKTYFYPYNNAQPNDIGYINSANVIYVYEEDGKIYHVLSLKPLKIHKVKCTINWERRYDYMQRQLAQHIISACFAQLLNANILDVNLGDDYSYIDIDKIITIDEAKTIENMANKIISDNINVEILYLTNSELKKLSLKKTHSKSNEKIRIVKIGDIYVNRCDGLHTNSTIEIQVIKISNFSKHQNGTRIQFICGSRAVSDYLLKYEWIEKMSKILHCSDVDVLCKVEGLKDELNKAVSEKAALKTQVAEYEVQDMLNSSENIKNIRLLKSIYSNVDSKYINLLASKLVSFPNVIVLFGIKFEDKTQLIFMCSKDLNIISMNSLLKDAITLIDGKGGGSDFSAQGGGKNNNNLASSIDYAYNKIKDFINSTCVE